VPVSAGSHTLVESEVQLAVAPGGTIAIAWIAEVAGPPYSWIGYRFSTDGGMTFSPIGRLSLPNGLAGSDPAVAVDASGNFYLAALGAHFVGTTSPTPDYTRIFIAEAPKGTTAFGAWVEASDPQQTLFHDHPKIFVTAAGTIVVVYAQAPSVTATMGAGQVARSTDGVNWQRTTVVGPPAIQFANLFWLCEGAGILYTTYLEATSTNVYIALRSSTDEGATWTSPSTVVSLASEVAAGLDPTCVAFGNDVWVAYATNTVPTTDPTNFLDTAQTIPIAHIGERGSTVDATRTQSLDKAAGALGLLPVLVREAGGTFDVAYLTGSAEGDTAGSMRYTRMAGTTFGPSVEVDGPLVFTANRAQMNWLGDYLGATVSGNHLLLAYPMNAGGTTHIYFRSMLLP
jgi:hypothetical protein